MTAKICTVVGVGPGIGLAVAKRFGKEGFKLALLARRAEALATYQADFEQQNIQTKAFVTDVSDINSIEHTFVQIKQQLGYPDVLVYNPMSVTLNLPSALETEELMANFKINVVGAIVCAQQVIPEMRAKQQGTILFTGGGLALQPYPQLLEYASLALGKAALRNFTYNLGLELEKDNIQVATVTVTGSVQPNTHFDPDLIAEKYWLLYTQKAGEREREIVY